MEKEIKCVRCGKVFERRGNNHIFCSMECRQAGRDESNGSGRKKRLSIDVVVRLAKAEGLSYGQYIVKYGG